jgi:hypothetical protein
LISVSIIKWLHKRNNFLYLNIIKRIQRTLGEVKLSSSYIFKDMYNLDLYINKEIKNMQIKFKQPIKSLKNNLNKIDIMEALSGKLF